MKTCKTCQNEKPEEEFYPCGKYLHSRCKICHNKASIIWTKNNPDKVKVHRRKQRLSEKYNLSIEEYDRLFLEQRGVCKLCEKEHIRRKLSVDHNHTTGKIRGLLCDKCNLAIGLFNDNPSLLQKTIDYLKD